MQCSYTNRLLNHTCAHHQTDVILSILHSAHRCSLAIKQHSCWTITDYLSVSFIFLTSYRRSLPLLRPNKMLCVYNIMFAPQYYSKGFPTSPFHCLTINASIHMGLLIYTAYSALLFLCSTIILPPTVDRFRQVYLHLQHVLRKLFLTCAAFIYQSTAEPPLYPPSDYS